MIDVVLFDLDATLVDDGLNWRQSVQGAIELVCDRDPACSADRLSACYYESAGSVWEEIRAVEAPPFGNMDDVTIVRRVWREALRRADVAEPVHSQVVARYLDLRSSDARAFDDARECLGCLAGDFRMGIVTNGSAGQQVPKLASSGLASYFDVVTTTDIGHGKPQPEIFRHALSALSASPDRAAYVGDSLTWDVSGANRAGLASVWLNRGGAARKVTDPVPDMQIESLIDLPEALRDLTPGSA